ncbi:MAG: hypothetical protein E7197_10545 [Anaerovibrio sp.]|uniref:hypothetical protein n=1 Tax=Anaerovibrio sp. TaxID=1872532 RepID=UPI0025BC97B8|nr:hypothetical protein [Anaerovibrio sp.]MBE6100472.1 hypothetical protein [Anaerovibrio sp.]
MGNRYFSQYLLNAGVLDAGNISDVMPKSAHAVPQLHILAMQQHLLSESQVEELSTADDVVKTLEEAKMLSDAQIESLKNTVPGRDARVAQTLLDEHIADLKTIERCFREYDNDELHPIKDTVKKIVSKYEEMNPVADIYGEYTEMFVGALQRFMNTDAVVLTEATDLDFAGTRIVSQSMGGQLSLAVAVLAKNQMFLEMARRYSGEDLTELDELAEDSLAEFINVLNGLYIVNLSGRDLDMDLDMPRSSQDVGPTASNLIAMRIVTDFGSFVIYLAEDEFIY